MFEYALETDGLTKRLGRRTVLDRVNLALKPGRIYGLIGRNGAGKTTLLRLIAGLSFATEGEIRLFGQRGEAALHRARKRLGIMIEAPSINASMTAEENVALHRMIRGIPNREQDRQLLELVGLSDAGKKRARHFSLGMKQRLGIAQALVGNPELLALDEPINGLDPMGIAQVRRLLQTLCEERGMTLLLSSHNLPELYQTATDYIIIDRGVIRRTVTLKALEEQCRQYLSIRADDPARAVGLIEREMGTDHFLVMPDRSIRLFDCNDRVEEAARLFQAHGLLITKLSVEGTTLEDYFLETIGGERDV